MRGWNDWVELPAAVGDRLGAAALGAAPGQVLVSDSTTVNLYKLAGAALDARPGAIVADAADFPTDRYVLQGLAARRAASCACSTPTPSRPAAGRGRAACAGGAALVVLSAGRLPLRRAGRMAAITAAAHAAGALVLWDLCHAPARSRSSSTRLGADLAVGCTYKYLNAGPGAPAFLYVRAGLQAAALADLGLVRRSGPVRHGPGYEPGDGHRAVPGRDAADPRAGGRRRGRGDAGRGRASTASRAKARGADRARGRLDQRLAPLGFTLGTPREPTRRGAHVRCATPTRGGSAGRSIERADVIPDFRAPDSIRFGLSPLYTRFVDVWDGIDRLRA